MRTSAPIGAWEQAQLRVFVEVDVVLKWRHSYVSLEKKLGTYLDAHLCHTLGLDEVDNLYRDGWIVSISVDKDYFVVELVKEEQNETQ